MRAYLSGLLALLTLAATPALAAPCTTQGTADAAIPFPKNDASDVPLARSMVMVMMPDVVGALPKTLACTRSTVPTPLGDYTLGGENGDALPRVAMRADGKAGPIVYVAASPEAPATFALVVQAKDKPSIVKRFYAGIPTDARLAEDLRAALADDSGIMAFDAKRKMVMYGFAPDGGMPPPSQSGPRPGGGSNKAGPQIFIPGDSDPSLLDTSGTGIRHKPSGFACPETFEGQAVLLMSIEPNADHLSCAWRAGTELRYSKDDAIRYQLDLVRAGPRDTPRSFFDDLTAQGRAALHITGDHAPPLATGPAPLPELVAYWDTRDEGVQGLWVGKAGGWIVSLRAQYAPSAANDAEAGKVAAVLFAEAGKQVR